jgi:DNA-binding transcriptional LysR family regulator
MLHVEAAALAAVGENGLAGRIRLGIPDDYAESFLPEILTRFVRRHPLVELEVACESSFDLAERMKAGDLDLAIVTDNRRFAGVEVVREEPLRWVTGVRSTVHEDRPLPLALSGPACAWRQAAISGLDGAGVPWRLALVSATYAGIGPIVGAGLAVTVLPPSAMRAGQRTLGAADGLPELPPCRIGLLQNPSEASREAAALAEEIRSTLAVHAVPGEGRDRSVMAGVPQHASSRTETTAS